MNPTTLVINRLNMLKRWELDLEGQKKALERKPASSFRYDIDVANNDIDVIELQDLLLSVRELIRQVENAYEVE